MSQTYLAINCVLLALLCSHCVLSATVRPYKFGFTIEEQQHRAEQRDEKGIVMGEFGFITADGIYHVTVYATDEEGKFHIISMKNYPYAGPVAPKVLPAATTTTTTQRTTPALSPKHNFITAACSGCFLSKSPPEEKDTASAPPSGNRSPKTEIRPLSQALPLAPVPAGGVPGTQPGRQPFGAVGNAAAAGQQPAGSSSPSFKPAVGNAAAAGQPGSGNLPSFKPSVGSTAAVTATSKQQPGGSSLAGFKPVVGSAAAARPQQQPASVTNKANTPTKTGAVAGQTGAAGLTGDLYKFKYILDYNGHEETGSRNGDKQGNYFAIGDDAIARTVEYIANEFGFQPHISWRKLEGNEAVLPDENSLKHYEFKWFNKA